MQRLELKATHKPVQNYFAALRQFGNLGVNGAVSGDSAAWRLPPSKASTFLRKADRPTRVSSRSREPVCKTTQGFCVSSHWRRLLTTPDGDTLARKEQRHGEHLADAHEALPCLHNARDDERERREYFLKAELPALMSSPSAYPPVIPLYTPCIPPVIPL